MATPTRVDDIHHYAGDPLRIRCDFTGDDDLGIDLGASTWEFGIRGDAVATVNTDEAADGVVFIDLTGDETRKLVRPFSTWDLRENGRWNRTMLIGRIVREDEVDT